MQKTKNYILSAYLCGKEADFGAENEETSTAMMDIIPKAKSLCPAVLCDTKAICALIDCFIALLLLRCMQHDDASKGFWQAIPSPPSFFFLLTLLMRTMRHKYGLYIEEIALNKDGLASAKYNRGYTISTVLVRIKQTLIFLQLPHLTVI